jgi:hypothetical protein
MIFYTVPYVVGEASVPVNLPQVAAALASRTGFPILRKFTTVEEATAFITANEGVFVTPGTVPGTLEEPDAP